MNMRRGIVLDVPPSALGQPVHGAHALKFRSVAAGDSQTDSVCFVSYFVSFLIGCFVGRVGKII